MSFCHTFAPRVAETRCVCRICERQSFLSTPDAGAYPSPIRRQRECTNKNLKKSTVTMRAGQTASTPHGPRALTSAGFKSVQGRNAWRGFYTAHKPTTRGEMCGAFVGTTTSDTGSLDSRRLHRGRQCIMTPALPSLPRLATCTRRRL